MPPAARITDLHTCPMVIPGTPPIPHVGGPVCGPCTPAVLIGGLPAAVVGDACVCVGPPDTIVQGSMTVLIGRKPAARMGDKTAHGGMIVAGCPTVMIGDAGKAGGGGARSVRGSSSSTPAAGGAFGISIKSKTGVHDADVHHKEHGNESASEKALAAQIIPGKSLLPGEGAVGTYDDLIRAGTKGDNITPHHIPSANHMARHSVAKGDGIAINMEHPHPGLGGRHRKTFTYGTQADVTMTPRQALAAGIIDARRIYKQDGLYTAQIRKQLQELICQNRAANPGLFAK